MITLNPDDFLLTNQHCLAALTQIWRHKCGFRVHSDGLFAAAPIRPLPHAHHITAGPRTHLAPSFAFRK